MTKTNCVKINFKKTCFVSACRLLDWRVPRRAIQGPTRPRRQDLHAQEDDGPSRCPGRVHFRQETHGHGRLDYKQYTNFNVNFT